MIMRYIEQFGKTKLYIERFAALEHSSWWKRPWLAGLITTIFLFIKSLGYAGKIPALKKAEFASDLKYITICSITIAAVYILYAVFFVYIPSRRDDAENRKHAGASTIIYVIYCLAMILLLFRLTCSSNRISFLTSEPVLGSLVIHISTLLLGVSSGRIYLVWAGLGTRDHKIAKTIWRSLFWFLFIFLWFILVSVWISALTFSNSYSQSIREIGMMPGLFDLCKTAATVSAVFAVLHLFIVARQKVMFGKLIKKHVTAVKNFETLLNGYDNKANPKLFGIDTTTKWMTNTDAIEYYKAKYGPDPRHIAWSSNRDFSILKQLYDLSYDSAKVKQNCYSPYNLRGLALRAYASLEDTEGSLTIHELEREYINDFEGPITRLNEIANNFSVYQACDAINGEINQYFILVHGHTGEKQVTQYLAETIGESYPETQIIENCNLIGSDKKHSVEHDVMIINRKGVTTVEIKNYSGEIRIEKTGMITINSNPVGEDKNFIAQSNSHISNLMGFLEEKHINARVNGAVVFACSDTNIINESEYPAFVYPMFATYMNELTDCLSIDEVNMIADTIKRRSRGEKKFPHTVYRITDDFRNNADEKLQLYMELKAALKKASDAMTELYYYPEKSRDPWYLAVEE